MVDRGLYFNFTKNDWGFLIVDTKDSLERTHDAVYDLLYPSKEIKRVEGKCKGNLCYRALHLNSEKDFDDLIIKDLHDFVIRDKYFYFWEEKEDLKQDLEKRFIHENLL